ncbi:MAG TPA: hypothetical protein VGP48_01735 [Stellaceae bacterium]|jgi:hypothetical protein|nr:hypothetical protein [Stellaceae bacterium]
MKCCAFAVCLLLVLAPRADAQQPSGDAVDTCALATTAELQAIVNQPVRGPLPGGPGICAWQIGGMNAISIQYNATGQAGFDNAKSRTTNTVALSGIGDAAFAFVSAAGFVQVDVVKHNRFVVVIDQGGGAATRLAAAKAIAAKVASRL